MRLIRSSDPAIVYRFNARRGKSDRRLTDQRASSTISRDRLRGIRARKTGETVNDGIDAFPDFHQPRLSDPS